MEKGNSSKSEFVSNWKQCISVTNEIIKSIPEKAYFEKPFNPRFRSFAWEFACILSTRKMYIEGILKKTLNGNTNCINEREILKWTKKKVETELKKSEKEIFSLVKDNSYSTINFFGEEMDKRAVMSWLCQHEHLHFGKLILYCAQAGVPQAKSLQKMWGEQSFR